MSDVTARQLRRHAPWQGGVLPATPRRLSYAATSTCGRPQSADAHLPYGLVQRGHGIGDVVLGQGAHAADPERVFQREPAGEDDVAAPLHSLEQGLEREAGSSVL